MPILPLPQFESDLAEQDREIYERLKPPSSIVVRFGLMKMVGEFPYSGDLKPGCGSKIVIKSHRGTELGEMLTSTCPNSGCSKSVSRKEMLDYIENSGGKDYPFFSMQGKALRIAAAEDLNEQARIDSSRPQMTKQAHAIAQRMGLNCKIVDSEPIIGGEKITFYFASEDRIDFRELVTELASIHHTRIEMRQVGARDEARLIADYEKCGQHCCCKQFLKVLKPISMKSAKIQKATLDPLKISGRCGRLMCCLRYEDATYDELRAKLPKKKTRVKTELGWGTVLDTQILTQLALVNLDDSNENVAIAVEELELAGPDNPAPPPPPPPQPGDFAPRGRGGPGGPGGPGARRPTGSAGPGSRPSAPPMRAKPAPEGDAGATDESVNDGMDGPGDSRDAEGSAPAAPSAPQQRPPQGGPPRPPSGPSNRERSDRGPRPDRQPARSEPPTPPRSKNDDEFSFDDIETDTGVDTGRSSRGGGRRDDRGGGGGGPGGPGGPGGAGGGGGGGGRRRDRGRGRGPSGGGGPGGPGGGGGGGDGPQNRPPRDPSSQGPGPSAGPGGEHGPDSGAGGPSGPGGDRGGDRGGRRRRRRRRGGGGGGGGGGEVGGGGSGGGPD